jgi:hypothetical protein
MGPVDPEHRERALALVYTYLALRPGDLIRFECTFVSGTDHFVARIDYSTARKGGYQVIEGVTAPGDGAILSVSRVMGKGRVTPTFPLRPTRPVKTGAELEDEKRKQDLEFEFDSTVTNERIV